MDNDLKMGYAALQSLEEAKFEERNEAKRNFETLYKTFAKFKQTQPSDAEQSQLPQ